MPDKISPDTIQTITRQVFDKLDALSDKAGDDREENGADEKFHTRDHAREVGTCQPSQSLSGAIVTLNRLAGRF